MPPDRTNSAPDVAHRIRNLFASLDITCECRGRLDGALIRFLELEGWREARKALEEARLARATIAALAALLREIDDVGLSEPDTSVFEEMALLFEDAANAAQRGAAAMRAVPSPVFKESYHEHN